ncbi:outer membrane protein [Duganella sp. CF517]|uniref:MipA/OmpV family protein n=1 Tax=Duganella sp. CF517 TaxID=1881038 RepID=UPI0008C97271|nr:MipA/OmpV family protein [Duganella sp. CF517]SEN88061.1 outer membrane protein [Duganella sp. CF517]
MQLPRIPTLAFPSAIKHARLAAALALGLCATGVAGAAAAGEASSWGLGVAAFSAQQPYAGIDRENRALPLISYENQYVRVFGPVAEFKAYSVDLGAGQRLDLRVVGKYDFSGYETGDAPILNGMRERKSGFWAGGKMIWRTGIVDVSAELLADASGNSKGRRANLGLEKTWRIGEHLMLTPRAGVAWVDKKYVDYYYGVAADEARAGRPAYVGKSGVNAELGLRGTYVVDAHHSLFVDVGVTKLAKKIKDSPLVDRANENRVGLGYLYRF